VSNALAVLDRNPATGKLTFGEVFHHGRDGVEGIGYALSVAISPTGKTVYVTGHGDSAGGGSVAVFTRATDSGRLSFVEGANAVRRPSYGLHGACWITTSPKSGYIYLSSSAKSITVFRDPADGPEESPK
jgi:DNA-binding beta-propeller fold protein YncE